MSNATQFVSELFTLTDDVAIVSGGAGVLPSTMAITLARAGARVAVWGRGTNHPVAAAASQIAEAADVAADRVLPVTVDTADPTATQRAFDQTRDAFGMPTILVNGVGGNRGKSPFVDIDLAVFEDVVRMNLTGGLVVPLQVCARAWIASGTAASVINLASMTSYTPLSGVWAYNAAKAAVKSLTEGAAREFAANDIRVNAIAPGFFLGHQNRALLIADDETGELTARGQAIIDRTPYGRFGELGDIVGATLFLASRRASGFVTGVTLPVDGGYLVDNI